MIKNTFLAIFMLLVTGLNFNEIASAQGETRERQTLYLQIFNIGNNAIARCYGTYSDYQDRAECNKLSKVKSVLSDSCSNSDRNACQVLTNLVKIESIAAANAIAKSGKLR
jgi:hypothetical protein